MRAKLRRALRGLLERTVEVEIIGQEVCPLMLRWTFLDLGFVRAMVHYFPAEVSDRDPHDHPRPFVTLVLRGNYRDESWLPGDSTHTASGIVLPPPHGERLSTGAFRYRRADHLHIVETDAVGCWTLVVMGPIVRDWGFVRLTTGLWWDWGKYIQKFGGVVRCDAPGDTMGIPLDRTSSPIDYEGGDFEPEHIVPVTGDFVTVEDDPGHPGQAWHGKVENVSQSAAWVRGAETHLVRSVKVEHLRRPSDELLAIIEKTYYRPRG